MPRQTQERKNHVNLDPATLASVDRGVYADQNVRAHQVDTRPILNALSQIGSVIGEKARADREQKNNLLLEKGRLAGNTGEIDDELYAQQEAYRSGVDETRAKGEVIAAFNDAREEFEALHNNPDFNYQEWKKEKIEALASGASSIEQMKVANGAAARFNEVFDAQFSAFQARKDYNAAVEVGAKYAYEAVRGGLIKSPEQAQAEIQKIADSTALDDAAALKVFTAPFIEAIKDGQVQHAEVIESLVAGDPELGPRFRDALEFGQEKARKEALSKNIELYDEIHDRIFNLNFTDKFAEELVDKYGFNASQVSSFKHQQRVRRESQLRELQRDAAKLQYTAELKGIIAGGDILRVDDERRRDALKLLDSDFAGASMEWRQAIRSGDSTATEQAELRILQSLKLHQENGVLPPSFKRQLDAFDPQHPEQFGPELQLAAKLRSHPQNKMFIEGRLSGNTLAKLDLYDRAVERSGSHEEGLAALSAITIRSHDQVDKLFTNAIYADIRKAADKLGGTRYGEAVDWLESYTKAVVQFEGIAPEDALKKAKEAFEQRFDSFAGGYASKDVAESDLDSYIPKYIDLEVKPKLLKQGLINEDSDIGVRPLSNGNFMITREGGIPVLRDYEETRNGKKVTVTRPLVLPSAEIRSYVVTTQREEFARTRDERRAAQKRREDQLFEDPYESRNAFDDAPIDYD